jgi:hypothetical protein
MNAYVNYADISALDRKRLTTEAYRQSRGLRAVRLASILLPILFSGVVAKSIFPVDGSFPVKFSVSIITALILCAAIWEVFGRRQLKAEIERLKNA